MASATDPTAAELEFPADAVEVARVLDAWGVKGWIRVQPFAADPQALFSSTRWFLKPPAHPLQGRVGAAHPLPGYLRVGQSRMQGDHVLAEVRGVDDRSGAEALRGARIFVSRQSFPSTQADEFYWVDLIGHEVLNRDAELLGRVVGLIDTGVHSVLRVVRDTGDGAGVSETLVPFVAAYIDGVDMALAPDSRRLGPRLLSAAASPSCGAGASSARCASTSSRCSPNCSMRRSNTASRAVRSNPAVSRCTCGRCASMPRTNIAASMTDPTAAGPAWCCWWSRCSAPCRPCTAREESTRNRWRWCISVRPGRSSTRRWCVNSPPAPVRC